MAYFHTAASKHGRAALNLHGGNIAESSRKNSPSRGAEAENDKVVYDNTIVHKIKAISNDGLQPTDEHEIYRSDQGVIPSGDHVSARCSPELPACELGLDLYIYSGESGPSWGSRPHNAISTFSPYLQGQGKSNSKLSDAHRQLIFHTGRIPFPSLVVVCLATEEQAALTKASPAFPGLRGPEG